jgi:ribonuclease Y
MEILKYMLPSLIGGIGIGYVLRLIIGRAKLRSAEVIANRILEDAKKEAEKEKNELLFKGREELHRERMEFEKEYKERRAELSNLELKIRQREENVEKRFEILEKRESYIDQLEKGLQEKTKQLEEERNKIQLQLEKIANLSPEEAKKIFLENIEKSAKLEALKIANSIESEAKRNALAKAREIICNAIQRNASELASELCVTTVHLPNDEIKGKIIGREGRNIRTLENLTGVDIIIDDTPDTVIISGYDLLRREIAKISLEKLIFDGRIHPTRIEEIVENVKKNIDEIIASEGEKVVFDLGLQGIHPEIIKMIGKLKYRLSYGQNALSHSIEVANLCDAIASELDLDGVLARRIGLFHDIGKCITIEEGGGAHALAGAEFLQKYNEDQIVINAIISHHGDRECETIYGSVLQAADAISAARPGARKENIDEYLKRLENLEKIASSFKGVEKSYAIQAGRELRVFVSNEIISDDDAKILAIDIAKKIENELKYPGQIKVIVIRETRVTEYAR